MYKRQAKNKRFESIIENHVKTLEPGFHKIDVGIGNTAAVLQVKEMRLSLHVVMERSLTLLTRHRGLHDRNGNTRMAGNIGKKPQDLVATELGNEMLRQIAVTNVGGATREGLMEDLIVEGRVIMAMSRKIGMPKASVIVVRHGSKRRNVRALQW